MNLYIENLGCAKNQVDAEVMAHYLEKDGWTLVDSAEDASLIIVNTCAFIESAREESIDTFLQLKQQYPNARMIMSGCLSQRYPNDLVSSLTEADAFFGNHDLSGINEVVKAVFSGKSSRPILSVPEYPAPEVECDERGRLFNFPGSAYLKISEGCNHRCGYCAIPVIRGELRSRPMEAVLAEAKRLVCSGIKEINLVAQDLAAYGTDWDGKSRFVELVDRICDMEGSFRIRMLYIHPDAFPMELLDLMENRSKIIPYFDIPFQHASAKLLKPMKRTGNQDIYASLVETIRTRIPNAVIRTTIMLGFPGDTKEDFDIVYDFVKRCRFNWMGSFIYSLEEDTDAFAMTSEKEHMALARKARTWQKKLEKLQEQITAESLEALVGTEQDVLVEELIEGEELALGRIYSQAPDVDGLTVVMGRDMVPGNIYRCGITKVNGVDLEAVKIG